MGNRPSVQLVARLTFENPDATGRLTALFGPPAPLDDDESRYEVKGITNPGFWTKPNASLITPESEEEVYPIWVNDSKAGEVFLLLSLVYESGDAISVSDVADRAEEFSNWCEANAGEHGFTYSVYLTPGYG